MENINEKKNGHTNGYTNSAFEKDKETDATTTKNSLGYSVKAPEPTLDFDDLLPHIGEFGRYQKVLFLFMIPFAFFVAFVYFAQIFIILVPEQHWCQVPELSHLSMEQRVQFSIPREANGNYHQCKMYHVNYTEMLSKNVTEPDPKWPIGSCRTGWEYNYTDVPYETIASELDWVCDDSYLPTLSQSIFFMGAICGGLLFGWVADRFGRIPSLVGCNMMGFIAGIGTAYCTSFTEFAICRFFVGFAFDNCFTMMYILVLEYVGPKWRTFVANMSIALFFTFAACSLPWLALNIGDWKVFTIVTSAPLALSILTPFCIPESARWLVSQGKTKAAMKILRKVEKTNGKTVDPRIFERFQAGCEAIQQEEAEINNYSILDLFRTPRLRNTTLLLIVIWMAISLVFDGHVRNVGQLGLDFYLTFAIASATELPADTFLTVVLDRWGRRWLAFGSMGLSGIFSLLATCVPQGIYSATLAMMGRFSVNISYNIGLQYAAELLPTVVRAQGVAFIHIMGYVAQIVAPFVVYLGNISQSLPLIILGVLGIIGGFLSLFLPETLGHELPQNLIDGEEFGKNQSFFEFPCISKKIDDETDEPVTMRRSMNSNGASLRASTGAELRSSILRRSVRRRTSNASTCPSVFNTRL